MPYINIWIHLVWSTKYRKPVLKKEARTKLFDHIRDNAKKKSIHLDCVDGYEEHVHCAISLSADQTISKVAQLLKGESAWWMNKEKLCRDKLEWQDEYFAESFNHRDLPKIRAYINNQENHHRKKNFADEFEELLKSQGMDLRTAGK